MKINQSEWKEFLELADNYHGPLTIGELFCLEYDENDRELKTADEETVWQMILDRYVENRTPIIKIER